MITGGAGFIGSNFILYRLRQHLEDQVLCLDELAFAGNWKSLRLVREEPRFKSVRGDICDESVVQDIFAGKWLDVVRTRAEQRLAV